MKKKFIVLISVIVAFIMSLSLVACGGNDRGGNAVAPSAGAVKSAMSDFLQVDGFAGKVGLEVSTKNTQPIKYEFGIEKRDEVIELAVDFSNMFPSESGIEMPFDPIKAYIDLKGGYFGMSPIMGFGGNQMSQLFPSGLFDYISGALGGIDISADDITLPEFKFNASTGEIYYNIALSEYANKVLLPLYDAYEMNKSIIDLAEDYSLAFSDDKVSVKSYYELLKTNIGTIESYTVDSFLGMLEDVSPQAVAVIREQIDNNFTVEQKAAIGSRTIGQMMVGLSKYLTSFGIASAQADDSASGSVSTYPIASLKDIVDGAIDAILFSEIDSETYEKDLQDAMTLVDTALKMRVNQVLPNLLPSTYVGMLNFLIDNEITFDKLDFVIAAKIDAGGKVRSISASANIKHSYTAAQNAANIPELFADNDYSFKMRLNIDRYLTNPTPFDLSAYTITSDASDLWAVVGGDLSGGLQMNIKPNSSVSIASVAVYKIDPTGDRMELSANDVEYDQTIGKLTIRGTALSTFFNANPDCELRVELRVGGATGNDIAVHIIDISKNPSALVKAFAGKTIDIDNLFPFVIFA